MIRRGIFRTLAGLAVASRLPKPVDARIAEGAAAMQKAAIGVDFAIAGQGPAISPRWDPVSLVRRALYRYADALEEDYQVREKVRLAMREGFDPDIEALKSASPVFKAHLQEIRIRAELDQMRTARDRANRT